DVPRRRRGGEAEVGRGVNGPAGEDDLPPAEPVGETRQRRREERLHRGEERPEERRARGGDARVLRAEKEEEVGRGSQSEDREAGDVGIEARRQALRGPLDGLARGGRPRRVLAHEGGEDEEGEEARDRRDGEDGALRRRREVEEREGGERADEGA